MVSGTTWPGGDPYLQRQNEPSLAVSTRNPLHLLAGANDYRTVDLPGLPTDLETGDAWLGVFKSFDGGQTWHSTLLPGCPQNAAPCNADVTLKGYAAASDPVVRAGTNGLFYYSGIAFDRSKTTSVSFVARFVDNNNKENGDPIQYLGTSVVQVGTPQLFLDKPWLAVDIPRSGAQTCNVNGQLFPGGRVYSAYSGFKTGTTSTILFSRSLDCGLTWSTPMALSDGNSSDQAATIAIDPASGTIYVGWRRFLQGIGSIIVTRSLDGGASFSAPVTVAPITAFDQSTTSNEFRTSAYPTIAVDASGRVYVAWADRTGPMGDARVVLSNSADGSNWSAPMLVDPSPARGHQLMPSLSFSAGKLTAIYYDNREDQTLGVLQCPPPQVCTRTQDRIEVREPAAQFPAGYFDLVFQPAIADIIGLLRRHTIEVRATQANPGGAPVFNYPSVRVSQYLFGTSPLDPSQTIEQIRFNVPNVPIFSQGTEPFLGDYIDVAPSPAFVPVVTGTRTVWRFNTATSAESLVHAVWTDNRDIMPPLDGDWTKYTPPKPTGPSQFDPTRQTPACDQNRTGMRNQNIYSARIASGVVAGSLGNAKPLSQTIERGFVVFVENTAPTAKSYRLSVASQPVGGIASFLPRSQALTKQLDVSIEPLSSISRTVFVTSSDPHTRVEIDVNEIDAPGGSLLPAAPGRNSTVLLNPDLTNPDLTNPDLTNPAVDNTPIINAEIYTPDLTNPDLTNPDLTNPNLTAPDVKNPDLTNPDLTNPDLTNPGKPNPDLTNADVLNPDLTNPNMSSPDLTNGAISDTIWSITNNGNTAAAYSIRLLSRDPIPAGVKLQLFLHKVYKTPVASNCTLGEAETNVLIANIPNPVFSTRADLSNPDLTNPDLTNPTLSLAPGEQAKVTLRTISPTKVPAFNPVNSVTAVSVAQASNTGSGAPSVATSRLTILTASLPDGVNNASYTVALRAAGNPVGALHWSITGALPPGLTLNSATGVITGTVATGTFPITVTVTDSAAPPNTDSVGLTLRVGNPLLITTVSPLPAGRVGQAYSQALTAVGGLGATTWSITFGALPPGLSLDGVTGIISGVPTTAGTYSFQAHVVDSSSPPQANSKFPITITVNP